MRSMICIRWPLSLKKAGKFEFAALFHVHPVKAVDQNVGDGQIFQQLFQRAQAEDFVENFARETLAFGEA